MSALSTTDALGAIDWDSPILMLLVELTNHEQTPERCLTDRALEQLEAAVRATGGRTNESIFHVLLYAVFVEHAGPSIARQLRTLCAKIVPELAGLIFASDLASGESLRRAADSLGVTLALQSEPRVSPSARTQPWMSRLTVSPKTSV